MFPPFSDFLWQGAAVGGAALLIGEVVAYLTRLRRRTRLKQRVVVAAFAAFGAFLPDWPICCCGCGMEEANAALFKLQEILLGPPAWISGAAMTHDLATFVPPRAGGSAWLVSAAWYGIIGVLVARRLRHSLAKD